MKILAALLLVSVFAFRQESKSPKVSVSEIPPEPIPTGICKQSYSGYLEISDHGKVRNTDLSPQEIGDYVKKRLGEGYSLELYPQASGRFFVIETCQTKN